MLNDTTIESLRFDLASGPVLYSNDELGGWCHQMGQYKAGNADKPAWCSFWSHKAVSVGRRTESLYVEDPFVAVAGMMVPGSAHELNHRGHGDDGFVHRMLIACPAPSKQGVSPIGVSVELTTAYKQRLSKLFQPPTKDGRLLRVEEKAFEKAVLWINNIHSAEVGGPGAPELLKARYKKLVANLWRIALVLHELWRVAGDEGERPADPTVIDGETIERAIAVVNYFKDHIARVQNHLGDAPMDNTDGLLRRFRSLGEITVRDFMLRTTYKTKPKAKTMEVFAEWEKRGYGKIEQGKRSDQQVFRFSKPD